MAAGHDDVTRNVYRERAEKWFRLMKSRLKTREGREVSSELLGSAGLWDYKPMALRGTGSACIQRRLLCD